MASTSTMKPATLKSHFPTGKRYGRIPTAAQAAINFTLTKREGALLMYYMSEPEGFAPSAHEVYLHTGIGQPDMVRARKELDSLGYITFNKNDNTITINWKQILDVGKLAMMLAENPECNVKETLKGGKFNPHETPTIGQLMRQQHDDDANPGVKSVVSEQYVKAGGFRIEELTKVEYLRWLKTGDPYDTTVEVTDTSTIGNESVHTKKSIEYLSDVHDEIEPYEKHGEFFIEGLTREEYEAWEKAGVPFVDLDGNVITA